MDQLDTEYFSCSMQAVICFTHTYVGTYACSTAARHWLVAFLKGCKHKRAPWCGWPMVKKTCMRVKLAVFVLSSSCFSRTRALERGNTITGRKGLDWSTGHSSAGQVIYKPWSDFYHLSLCIWSNSELQWTMLPVFKVHMYSHLYMTALHSLFLKPQVFHWGGNRISQSYDIMQRLAMPHWALIKDKNSCLCGCHESTLSCRLQSRCTHYC